MFQKWIFILLISFSGFAQKKSVTRLLETYNTRSIPYISVEELRMNPDAYLILDTRNLEEFEVSHLPGALWIATLTDAEKAAAQTPEKTIVVYCSVGIRSEDFGEKLKNKTSTSILNLYGGIFAWKDAGFPILDDKGQTTERVHTFSKNWQDYLKTGIAVY